MNITLEIDVGDLWYNHENEAVVLVENVYLERGIINVDYAYEGDSKGLGGHTADYEYFLKKYQRMSPYYEKEILEESVWYNEYQRLWVEITFVKDDYVCYNFIRLASSGFSNKREFLDKYTLVSNP